VRNVLEATKSGFINSRLLNLTRNRCGYFKELHVIRYQMDIKKICARFFRGGLNERFKNYAVIFFGKCDEFLKES
jgi:hypothetical protein